jgi:hypothetical protein
LVYHQYTAPTVNGITPFDILKDLSDITHTVYGFTPFNGTVISVTTSLYDGELYFPLGTSDSWSNPIAHTVVVVKMDDDRSFKPNIRPNAKAFIGDERYYLFDFPMDNPERDLHGSVGHSTSKERLSATASKAIFGTYIWLSVILALVLYLLLWFILLKASYLIFDAKEKDRTKRVLTFRNLGRAMLALLITAPGVHILTRNEYAKVGSKEAVMNRVNEEHSIAMLTIGAAFMIMAVV